jgi:hypothetical protein
VGRKSAKRELLIIEESERAAQLRLQGKSVREIAVLLSVSVATAQDRIQRGKAAWLERSADSHGAWVAQELARLEMLFSEAFAAWKRSMEPAERTRVTQDADGTSKMAEREGQCGDSSLLAECRALHERICALKGLDAPKRSELRTGPTGEPSPIEMTNEQLVLVITEAKQILAEEDSAATAANSQRVIDAAFGPAEDAGLHRVHVSSIPGGAPPPSSSGLS